MSMNKFGHFLYALLGILALTVQLVHAQDQSGFVSLDCGSPSDTTYTETTTSIDYISDAAFIDTGIGKRLSSDFQKGMQRQTWYVRSFPDGIRNCYKFNLTKGSRYLIRAGFIYGNYDEQDKLPEFDLHIGPNKWTSVKLQSASPDIMKEIIHVLQSSHLHLCLVNIGSGTPFISYIEIRTLKSSIYKAQDASLDYFARLDVASLYNRTVRYEADVYDRIWWPFYLDNTTQLSTSMDMNSDYNDYQPPYVVMRTAATPANASAPLDFYLETNNDTTLQFYVYLHFAEIMKLQANESREFNISLNGENWYGPFSPSYLSTTTVFNSYALSGGKYSFSIYKTETSTHPPILNALEVYLVKEFLQPQTDQKDVDAITSIKMTYGLKRNWQGDPCAPQAYLWNGLNCSYDVSSDSSSPPRIKSLNLSSSALNGEIASFILNLTLLESLDLSNNNLTGSVPDFLSQLPLRVLNLEGNKLTGSVPAGLLERSENGFLLLNFGGNPDLICPSGSCEEQKKKNVVVPVVAAVAGSVVLIAAALAVFFIFKRRAKVGKVKPGSNKKIESFESKSRQFSYSEVLKITSNFERILGKGGFGTVYHGRIDEVDVAVKMLSPSSVQGFQQFQAEVTHLMRVHHKHLTSLVGYCDEGEQKALVYEYMAHGNLEEHLSGSSRNVLSWEGRLQIALEAAQGLEYLHHGCKPPIIHRDVKSANILLNENFHAKLADFGLSKSFLTEAKTHVSTVVAGTPGYLDPEYYISNRLTEKSDVHSFGVVLLEIITCRPVIAKISAYEKMHISQWVSSLLAKGDIKSIVDLRLQGDFHINSVWKAVELAMACVDPTANKRPTMNQVVIELNECLATEIARTKSAHGFNSKDSVNHMISMNLGTELNPRAR